MSPSQYLHHNTSSTMSPSQCLQDLTGQPLAVEVELPVTGAPALQAPVEVGPILLQRSEVQHLAQTRQRVAQQLEISAEQVRAQALAVVLVVKAADEIGDVLHAATTADVLEVDRRNLAPVGAEAELGQLGVPVDEGLELAVGEPAIDGHGRRF